MPTLAMFYGITIHMYFRSGEHNPPHIHAFYNEDEAMFDIHSGRITAGRLPARARALVEEWLIVNSDALLEMWETQVFRKLPPLE